MKKIERFEDLIAWQKARKLTREIYEILVRFPLLKIMAFQDKSKAAVSIMSTFQKALNEEVERVSSVSLHGKASY
jgi:hypothetical protein